MFIGAQHISLTLFLSVVCLTISIMCVPLSAQDMRITEGKYGYERLRFPGKKGIGLSMVPRDKPRKREIYYADETLPIIKKLHVYWNYAWSPRRSELQPDNIEYVPMVWGAGKCQDSKDLQTKIFTPNVLPQYKSGKIKRIFGFNEPDHHSQANMSYQMAIELWPAFLKYDVPVCSPVCANPEGINDDSVQGIKGTWMRDFMREADTRGYRVDYTGVHWYGDTSAQAFKAKMKRIYLKYGNRPLVISEFAPADWTAKGKDLKANKRSADAVLKFAKEVLPWMEETDWIIAYAWFPFRTDQPQGVTSALYYNDGSLTALGKYYASVTTVNPEGDQNILPEDPRDKLNEKSSKKEDRNHRTKH